MANKRKMTKEQTTIYKNCVQKNNDQATPTQLKNGMNSGDAEELAVPAPHVAPVVLLLLKSTYPKHNLRHFFCREACQKLEDI